MAKVKSHFPEFARMLVLLSVFLLVSAAAFSGVSISTSGVHGADWLGVVKMFVNSEFSSIVPVGLLLSGVLPFLNPVRASLLTLGAAIIVLAICFISSSTHIDLLLEFGLLSVGIIFSVHVLASFYTEYNDKKRLGKIFSQYIPPELVKEYVSNPGLVDLDGISVELTTLFCDIRGFTSMSENLPPKDIVQIINHFSTLVTRIILQYKGTIDKYLGDCVMAFWGAPLPNREHAKYALMAAIEIQREMVRLREYFKLQSWPEIHVGVGLNTGICSVGNMGSSLRITYTAMGDSVNVAERIEKLTRRYNVPVLLGEETVKKIPDLVFRDVDISKVRGHTRYMKIYEPVGLRDKVPQKEIEQINQYHQALSLYRKKYFSDAATIFEQLHHAAPEASVYEMYLESARIYAQESPADDWLGAMHWRVYKASERRRASD